MRNIEAYLERKSISTTYTWIILRIQIEFHADHL